MATIHRFLIETEVFEDFERIKRIWLGANSPMKHPHKAELKIINSHARRVICNIDESVIKSRIENTKHVHDYMCERGKSWCSQ